MVKLTDTQLIVLSKAAAREDSAAVVPPKINKAAAAKTGSSLIGRKLMREIRSKPGMPVWREDEDGRSMSLVITRAGRNAIGINEPDETYLPASSKQRCEARRSSSRRRCTACRIQTGARYRDAVQAAGAKATGWLPHTTRAALTGLRKRGFAVERTRNETKGSLYRIANGPNAAAGA